MLTVNELKRLSTGRLLNVLKSARAIFNAERNKLKAQEWCCSMCKVWVGTDAAYETQVVLPLKHIENYIGRIKNVLKTREHID